MSTDQLLSQAALVDTSHELSELSLLSPAVAENAKLAPLPSSGLLTPMQEQQQHPYGE